MLTIKEFKAWFDGFAHCIDEVPTKAQWMTIRKKMTEIEIDGVQYIPFPVYPNAWTYQSISPNALLGRTITSGGTTGITPNLTT